MELDIIYSPIFWLVLNILVAFGILKLRKSLSAASKTEVEEFVEGPFWRLERTLSMEVASERQKEYLKNCINIFLQLLDERKLLEVKPSSTVRETLQTINSKEAMDLVELYEAVRFGQRILSEEELRVFKTSLRHLARMLIH